MVVERSSETSAEPVAAPKAAPLRRDAILEAVTFAADHLLLAEDWREAVEEVLARFGIAARVSRVVIVQATAGPDGTREQTLTEWCAPGGPATRGGARAGDPITPGFERWSDAFSSGQAIVGDVADFPETERAVLVRHDIVSLAYCPITVEGRWWGSLGFEDCEGARAWSLADLDGARTAAAMVGAAITRQLQADRLIDAETRYRGVVERIPAVTYVDVSHPSGVTMAFLSPQIEALLGYEPARFLDDPDSWFDLVHPDDQARVDEAARHAGATGERFDEEYRMCHADGHWVWVHDTSTRVPNDDGTDTKYFQGFLLDVTARKQAEAERDAAERRYRRMVEALPAVTYIDEPIEGDDDNAMMPFVSPQIADVLGYPPERFMQNNRFWFELMHPDDYARLRGAGELSVSNVTPVAQEYRMRHADGRWIWVRDTSVPVYDDAGKLEYFQGFMIDVSKRHAAEEQLRVAEERYRQIVEHTPVVSYQESPSDEVFSLETSLLYMSPQMERILGYPPETWSEPGFWASVTHADDLAAMLRASEQPPDDPDVWRAEYRMFAADGRVVWFHDEAHLVRDSQGNPVSWQGVLVDISERREAEDQLQRAQQRLQALIDHIPAVVYREAPDASPEKFFISSQVEQILGYTPHEWTWTPDFWETRLHPDDHDRVMAAEAEAARTLQPYSREYRFRRADGSYVWVLDEATFLPSGDDEEGAWQGLLFDVTARKAAEEQLRSSELVHSATIEHLPAIVYREPGERALEAEMFVSPQLEEILGYPAEDWLQDVRDFWAEHIHPEDVDAVMAENERANATKEPFSADYRFRHRDGGYRWVHDEATFVEDTNGGWWQGFIIDITERRGAEDELREAEERFRLIVERGPAIFYQQEFDREHPDISRTTYISPQQADLFGYTNEEMLADPTLWARTVHPDDRDRVLAADIDSNGGDGDQFSMEYRMIARDGRIVWVQDTCSIVRAQGKAPYWQGFILDITERKHAEEQLARALEVEREATRRLRALDEMKNTFLQAVSHDLRTPLAAILGLAITLERGDVHLEEDDAKDLARRIAGNARRLDRLVTNLLDLDRLARGIVAPNLQPTDVGALVRRVLSESELIPDTRLRTDLAPVVVHADAAKLERIVENLLANTVRHTPATSTIWVRVAATDEGALLAVEDDGDGVDEDMREAIFEPFRQGPNAPRHSPGVGVGLTLVRRFAELHGGRAWVQERDGGGASFRVVVPFEPPEGAAAAVLGEA
jgi:PAS domain S-box-containing protein